MKRLKFMSIILMVALGGGLAIAAVKKRQTDVSPTMEAYQLRMAGKAGQAKEFLEKALAENPKDASAYYELARTQFHMTLGDPKNIETGFAEVQQLIERAVKNDPNNVIYPFFAGQVSFMQAYYSLMTGDKPGSKKRLARACRAFESALKLKPDYHQAMLYLVELYSQFPEEFGGDKSKAKQYAKQLEKMDDVFGAKAGSILLPEEADKIAYWQNILENHEGNADVLEESGKAYLRADKVDDAVLCFEKAIKINPEKKSLFLDLSIYYTFSAMKAKRSGGNELFKTSIVSGNAAVTRYIESKPIRPMLAYALGVQSRYKSFSDEKEQGQALYNRAKAMDPWFSKATGAPHPDLFILPTEISQNHRYLMRPF